jgi:hypothetical protein
MVSKPVIISIIIVIAIIVFVIIGVVLYFLLRSPTVTPTPTPTPTPVVLATPVGALQISTPIVYSFDLTSPTSINRPCVLPQVRVLFSNYGYRASDSVLNTTSAIVWNGSWIQTVNGDFWGSSWTVPTQTGYGVNVHMDLMCRFNNKPDGSGTNSDPVKVGSILNSNINRVVADTLDRAFPSYGGCVAPVPLPTPTIPLSLYTPISYAHTFTPSPSQVCTAPEKWNLYSKYGYSFFNTATQNRSAILYNTTWDKTISINNFWGPDWTLPIASTTIANTNVELWRKFSADGTDTGDVSTPVKVFSVAYLPNIVTVLSDSVDTTFPFGGCM